MLGKWTVQRGLFESDHLYLEFVGADCFYGYLASQRGLRSSHCAKPATLLFIHETERGKHGLFNMRQAS